MKTHQVSLQQAAHARTDPSETSHPGHAHSFLTHPKKMADSIP